METTAAPTQKTCTKCLVEKPLSEFHRDRSRKDGYRSHCRGCVAEYRLVNRARDLAQKVERHTQLRNRADHEIEYPAEKWCFDCSETKPASEFYKNRNHLDGLHSRCKICWRWRDALHRYGLSRSEWEVMWEVQDGQCAICQEPMEAISEKHNHLTAVVDHCHAGGQVRALLHSGCNRALGVFKDDPAILRRAARYLELHAGGYQSGSESANRADLGHSRVQGRRELVGR